ncbi:MAG: hypothetical protein M3161_05810, partial [Actinomycetota bacterium]|nr:hypothetical protein [Actinomycetota bacterium]
IAAAARVALETGPGRLAEDHANARRLAEGVLTLAHVSTDVVRLVTHRDVSGNDIEVALHALRRVLL